MSHPDEGVLQELLDGELAQADAAVIRVHLAGCASCAAALQELEAMQAQADAIVARLPLDPPLVNPSCGHGPPACQPAHDRAGRQRSACGRYFVDAPSVERGRLSPRSGRLGRGLALPMPSEERQEVPATTPATPPPPSPTARTDAGVDRRDKAKQASRQAEKKKTDAEGLRVSESLPANAAPPGAAPPAASSLRSSALERTSGRAATVAGAEARLGTRLRTISGLTPVSVEVLPVAPDSLLTVRQQYVVGGVTVLLVQQALPAPRDEVTSKAREPVPYVDDLRIRAATRANGLESVADSAGVQPASRTWEAWAVSSSCVARCRPIRSTR